jgi:hypothetical protein
MTERKFGNRLVVSELFRIFVTSKKKIIVMARILVNKSSNTYSIVGIEEKAFFTLLKTINKVAMKVADPDFKEVTDATARKIVDANNELRSAFAHSVEI